MKELVGHCAACGKELYCRDGFLEAVIGADRTLSCFECAKQADEREPENGPSQEAE